MLLSIRTFAMFWNWWIFPKKCLKLFVSEKSKNTTECKLGVAHALLLLFCHLSLSTPQTVDKDILGLVTFLRTALKIDQLNLTGFAVLTQQDKRLNLFWTPALAAIANSCLCSNSQNILLTLFSRPQLQCTWYRMFQNKCNTTRPYQKKINIFLFDELNLEFYGLFHCKKHYI